MGKNIKIYYKPTCITCRKTIHKLNDSGLKFYLHDFFKERLTKDDVKSLLKMSGLSAAEIIRKKDKMYKELSLDSKKYTEDQLITLIAKYPSLLFRPIIVKGDKAIIGNKSGVLEFCRRG